MQSVYYYLLFFFLILISVESIEFKNQEHSNYGEVHDNKAHIREHLKALSENSQEIPPELSDEDMVYYLFLIHDVNNDGFLDGHELIAAFTDFGEEDASKYLALEEVVAMVDHVLEEDDLDGDGRISWSEYLESQSYHTK